jgi:conjugal transfer ATP-binding protein TraC
MAYDIPPPLRHKEAILWGLNWNQIGYAAPALLLSLFIILKAPLPIQVSLGFCSIILTTAVFFMFFEGKKRILDLLIHLKYQHIKVGDEKSKKIVNIEKIDQYVHTSKTKLAVLEITPINLMIKPDEDQESTILGFQKFLNSLDFPIQIHISSEKINLIDHYKQLKSKYKNLNQSYIKFVENQTENSMNRRFHIIIQEKQDLETQVQVCTEMLKSVGVKVKQLKNKKLFKFYFNYIAGGKDKEIEADQIIKNYTQHSISPDEITFEPNSFHALNKHQTVLTITGYPQSVERGFLDKLISTSGDYDISLHIEPFPIDETMIMLNRELQKQQSDLHAESSKGIINPSLDIKFKSTRRVLEDLQKGKQKLFHVSLHIQCKGDTKEEADLLSKKIKAMLDGILIQSKTPQFEMQTAYESMLPLARDTLGYKQNIHTQGLSAFFPFSSPFLDIDNDGILLGMNKNNVPYIKNIFNLTNANGIVLATSGAGKSYFTKLLISRQHMANTDVIIIDPQGEYTAITQHYKGEVIDISKSSKTIINPLDLMGHDYLEKRLSLIDLFKIMLGDLSEVQKAVLDNAIDETYAKKGINRASCNKRPPIMQDLYKTLERLSKKATRLEEVTYQSLLNRLRMYTDKGVFGFLNRQTNIDFSKNFVSFNIGAMPKQVKPVVMFLVLDYVYMRMKESKRKKILVIDEAWAMLQSAEESSYIFEIVKTCRKFNLGLLMITQDVADLVASKAGHAVLANTSYTFLLRQKPAVIKSIVSVFNLSRPEKEYLVSAQKGQGILILENDHQELMVKASKEEHELITTDPNERVVAKVVESSLEDIEIKLDTEQDVYEFDKLNIDERLYLESHAYTVGAFRDLDNKRQQKYFIKTRPPEGAKHSFYVDLLAKGIRKKTKTVEIFRTEKPDLIFKNKAGEEIVIEVETGIKVGTRSKKNYHNEKFSKLRNKYGKRCWVFVINQKMKDSYARHELPVISRSQVNEFLKYQFSGKKNNTFVRKVECGMRNSASGKQTKGILTADQTAGDKK